MREIASPYMTLGDDCRSVWVAVAVVVFGDGVVVVAQRQGMEMKLKLTIEFEAADLQGRDLSTPLMMLMQLAGRGFDLDKGKCGDISGLTPDGRELKISWKAGL